MSTAQPFVGVVPSLPSFYTILSELEHPAPTRRRTSMRRGQALELLSHAAEYIMDSRLYDDRNRSGDADAIYLLMACSKAVFEECDEIVPWRSRLSGALTHRFARLTGKT